MEASTRYSGLLYLPSCRTVVLGRAHRITPAVSSLRMWGLESILSCVVQANLPVISAAIPC